MSKPTKFHAPTIINLEHGFCDPACTSPSLLAVFRLLDGTRVEFAMVPLCTKVSAHLSVHLPPPAYSPHYEEARSRGQFGRKRRTAR